MMLSDGKMKQKFEDTADLMIKSRFCLTINSIWRKRKDTLHKSELLTELVAY